MGKDITNGNIVRRAKNGLNILSILTTWSLENAIETADSMKARGYGLSGRTAFSIYNFDKRDKKALISILILALYTLAGNIMGGMHFEFFPTFEWNYISPFGVSVFIAYLLLCSSPIIIEMWEVRRWKALRSKI